MGLIPNRPVEVFLHPELPLTAQQSVRLLGRVRLPRVNDGGKAVPVQSRCEHVHVVGHDRPRMQLIALAVEMEKRVLHHLRDTRVFEVACPSGPVQGLFDTSLTFALPLLFEEGVEFGSPLFEERAWEAVVEAEGYALRDAFCLPVREVAAGVPFFVRAGRPRPRAVRAALVLNVRAGRPRPRAVRAALVLNVRAGRPRGQVVALHPLHRLAHQVGEGRQRHELPGGEEVAVSL